MCFTIFCSLSGLTMRPLGVGVATLVRSFPNSQPFEPLASCALESRHYSEFFPTFSVFLTYLTLGFHRMYRLFVSYRSFSLIWLVFTLISSISLMFSLISLGRSCCTSTYDFVSFLRDFSDFCDTYGSISLPDTSLFPTVGPGTSSKSLLRF